MFTPLEAPTPTAPTWQLIVAALVGITVIIVLITKFKLHAFLSLTIGALIVGGIAQMSLKQVLDSYSTGVGGQLPESAF